MAYLDDKGLDLFHGLLDTAHREAVEQMLLDFCHPVGSLYFSDDATDPSELFGGTWSPLDEGYIRIGEPGTGGSDTVTLVMNNLPSHSHGMAHTHTMAHTHPGPSHTHTMAHTHKARTGFIPLGWVQRSELNSANTSYAVLSQFTNGSTTSGGGVWLDRTKNYTLTDGSSSGNTGASGTGNTGAASKATTSAASVETTGLTGKADPITIEPRYRATHGWVRTA